ncbi:hypothetical protein B0I35DRAFT_496422 [Stachybotrys elegans]|uniref:Heterokaryon incompatibility domain-containing protein n=1 Tax=Stachybotrys elegans TaxID=80388 RepID=A0A8K0SVK5_9HYPO|nr:hypothetical protein B0I35DRAFT_496422 [Stachybotrys elegans]
MEELLARNWMIRLWTYQGLMLSSNPVVVCVPATLVSITRLYSVVSSLANNHIRIMRDDELHRNEGLIYGLYSRSATDLKDMAFGMWAVLERPEAVGLTSLDCTQDVSDIHRLFASRMAQATNLLDILFLVAARNMPGSHPGSSIGLRVVCTNGASFLELEDLDQDGCHLIAKIKLYDSRQTTAFRTRPLHSTVCVSAGMFSRSISPFATS